MKILPTTFVLLLLMLSTNLIFSQDTGNMGGSQEELAKQAANPIANMISVPMQLNLNFGVGDYNRSSQVLNIMPVLPFKMFNWNVINRFILPIMNVPDTTETGNISGIANTNISMFFVPPPPGKGMFMYGFGPAFNIPTLSDPRLGRDVFSLGPTIVVLVMPGTWVIGLTVNQTWSYYPGKEYSTLFAQYFITYNIKKGWYVNTNPMLTADWTAPEGEQWLIPVGAGGGKVFHAGSQAMKLQAQVYYNVVAPPGAADWTVQIQYVLLFPHK
jgi:hypothetical protein